MKPIEIAKGIYWVGAVDWNIRDFHGYSTYQGTTYNAFLIVDDKIALIDAVKHGFEHELLGNIRHIVDPRKIDLVVSNHTEMDHSGGLRTVMETVGPEKPVYCSKMGLKNLTRHFGAGLNYQAVDDGGQLGLGQRTLSFMETRMLHWPDSMFTYAVEDKILFSSDAFGQHYAGPGRFDDEMGEAIMPHARKYFANILLLYAPLVLKLVQKVQAMGLDIRMICPDHGIMWRQDPGRIIQAYVEWSEQKPRRKALVVYDTMWHSTETMAVALVDALCQRGVEAKPMHLRSWHRSDIMTELLDAGAILVGSPTLNNGIFPTVADFMTYMQGLKPQNKVSAAFGSYGWSGEAVKMLTEQLTAMKFDVVDPGLRVLFVPDAEGLKFCEELADEVAAALPPA